MSRTDGHGGCRELAADTGSAPGAQAVIECADNLDFMEGLRDGAFKLIVTSPPYNLGKSYERGRPGMWLKIDSASPPSVRITCPVT